MRVVIGGYFELDSVDWSEWVEGIEPSPDLRIEESTPFAKPSAGGVEDTVRRDPGLKDGGTLNVTIVDDANASRTQWLWNNRGTKVTAKWRYDAAAKGVNNPEFTATVIVPFTMPPVTQGAGARMTPGFMVDGDIAMATS